MNKKITTSLIAVVLIVLVVSVFYFVPYYKAKKQEILAKKIKESAQIYTTKIIEEFSNTPNAKASDISRKVAQELNAVSKNPYEDKKSAFTFEKDCRNCQNIEYDDLNSMIILSCIDKNGEMDARIVIKPPSFVSYYKSEN